MKSLKLHNSLFILSIVSLSLIVGLSFFTFPSSDDFSLYMDLSKCSVFEHAGNMYHNWDGRSLSIPALLQYTLLKYCSAQGSTFVWSLSFIFNAFLLLKIILLECAIEIKSKKQLVIFWGYLAITLWLGFYSHISQTVYWSTGGIYSMASSFALAWIYLFLTVVTSTTKQPLAKYLLLIVLSVIAGTLSQNLVPALLVFVGYAFISKSSIRKNSLLVFFSILIGACFLYAAPGNYNRASLGPNTLQLQAWKMFYHSAYALTYYEYKSIVLVCLTLAFAFVLLPNDIAIRERNVITKATKWNYFLQIMAKSKWLIIALSTLLIFIVVPDFVSSRTAIFFMFFIVMFIVTTFHWFAKNAWLNTFVQRFNTDHLKQKIKLGAFIAFIAIILLHNYAATHIKSELAVRNKQLQNPANRGKDLCVSAIKTAIPFSLKFDDIKADSTFWINSCVAKYYGLRTVRLCK